MAGRTSSSSARHEAHRGAAAKARRKRAQHQPKRAAETSHAVESNAQEEDIGRDSAEVDPWDVRESEHDAPERASNRLGDIERDVEPDEGREDSDIERAH